MLFLNVVPTKHEIRTEKWPETCLTFPLTLSDENVCYSLIRLLSGKTMMCGETVIVSSMLCLLAKLNKLLNISESSFYCYIAKNYVMSTYLTLIIFTLRDIL